ncbi:MAG: helix-turn-helix transcriptional regulator [Clostridia bacterium]|nr:helix-turn-helix transcriptional regulator [Clostridia bacterium]
MVVQSKVAQYLEEQGIKQSWLAQKTGLTDNMISGILNGKRKMTADEFVRICKAIGKNPNDFMEAG